MRVMFGPPKQKNKNRRKWNKQKHFPREIENVFPQSQTRQFTLHRKWNHKQKTQSVHIFRGKWKSQYETKFRPPKKPYLRKTLTTRKWNSNRSKKKKRTRRKKEGWGFEISPKEYISGSSEEEVEANGERGREGEAAAPDARLLGPDVRLLGPDVLPEACSRGRPRLHLAMPEWWPGTKGGEPDGGSASEGWPGTKGGEADGGGSSEEWRGLGEVEDERMPSVLAVVVERLGSVPSISDETRERAREREGERCKDFCLKGCLRNFMWRKKGF